MIVRGIGASQDAKLHPHADPYRGFKEFAWDPIAKVHCRFAQKGISNDPGRKHTKSNARWVNVLRMGAARNVDRTERSGREMTRDRDRNGRRRDRGGPERPERKRKARKRTDGMKMTTEMNSFNDAINRFNRPQVRLLGITTFSRTRCMSDRPPHARASRVSLMNFIDLSSFPGWKMMTKSSMAWWCLKLRAHLTRR